MVSKEKRLQDPHFWRNNRPLEILKVGVVIKLLSNDENQPTYNVGSNNQSLPNRLKREAQIFADGLIHRSDDPFPIIGDGIIIISISNVETLNSLIDDPKVFKIFELSGYSDNYAPAFENHIGTLKRELCFKFHTSTGLDLELIGEPKSFQNRELLAEIQGYRLGNGGGNGVRIPEACLSNRFLVISIKELP